MGRTRRATVRSTNGHRPAGDRRLELRRNRRITECRDRDCQVSPHARAPNAAPRTARGAAMMHVLACDRVREDLAAYHDGELSIDEQVLIQNHLHECVACRLEAV